MESLEIGQVWYLRRPGASAIIKAKITDVTQKTVQIQELGRHAMPSGGPIVPAKNKTKRRRLAGWMRPMRRLKQSLSGKGVRHE